MIRQSLAALAAAVLSAGGAQAANLVVNGDFEAGNTGFSSDYTFGSGIPADRYTVTDNPRSWNGAFVAAGDHTTGDGLMFVANGGPDPGEAVWQSQVISILAGQDYFFEAFLMNAVRSNPPILRFTVSLDGGAELELGTATIPAGVGVWNGVSTTFNSGTATQATLYLRNAQTAHFGNDFAIDDIYLGTTSVVNPGAIPEPTTWAVMILGFGCAGAALRVRRRSSAMA